MPKAFWKGVISFGMVVIPVKMYVATEAKSLNFHLLHKKCLTRPKQVLHCEKDKEYFNIKDTVRGYEYAKEQYLVLDEEDFKKVPVHTAHTINILGFVPAEDIDHIYYQSSHYVEPEELGAKPFALLNKVLTGSGQVGLAKVSFARREHLCALRPMDDLMALTTMYYQDEIVSHKDLKPGKVTLTDAEIKMAESLVKAMAAKFNPKAYKDEYVTALKAVVDARLKGVKIKALPEEPQAEVGDLMEALKTSLAQARQKSKAKVLAGVK
jgi:DNA end-binding protein Ku